MAKPYVIGIDMGGTNTVFGIVDARGNVIATGSIKTAKHSEFSDYIDELHTELTRLIKDNEAEGKIQGIGIGAPNGNYYTGLIDQAPNLPWPTPIPLANMVTEKFGIPCLITNDANAAAIGEMISESYVEDTIVAMHSDFHFSITNDSLVRKAIYYSQDGKRVILTYNEYKGTVLWRGNSKYVATAIEVDSQLVKPNPYPREAPKK